MCAAFCVKIKIISSGRILKSAYDIKKAGWYKMDRVRSELDAVYAYKRGLLGGNVGVAVLDSGIAWRHPDLKGRVAYAAAFGCLCYLIRKDYHIISPCFYR